MFGCKLSSVYSKNNNNKFVTFTGITRYNNKEGKVVQKILIHALFYTSQSAQIQGGELIVPTTVVSIVAGMALVINRMEHVQAVTLAIMVNVVTQVRYDVLL